MPLALPVRRMPTATQLAEFLRDLLGKEVTLTARTDELGVDDSAGDAASLLCGVLVEEDGSVGGACVADLNAAAYAGASLAMIPKGAADEAVAAGALTQTLVDNFAEVVNIVTGIVNTPISAHLRMAGVEPGVPDAVRDMLIKAAGRSTFDVEIEDYGTGKIALFAR
jgi:hypothetical protein